MFKNVYFLKKKKKENIKSRLSVGGSVPEPPIASGGLGLRPRPLRCYFRPLLQLCRVFISSAKCVFINLKKEHNNYSKCSIFASALLYLFFTSNSVVFVDGMFLFFCYFYSRVQGTLAAPLC